MGIDWRQRPIPSHHPNVQLPERLAPANPQDNNWSLLKNGWSERLFFGEFCITLSDLSPVLIWTGRSLRKSTVHTKRWRNSKNTRFEGWIHSARVPVCLILNTFEPNVPCLLTHWLLWCRSMPSLKSFTEQMDRKLINKPVFGKTA